MTDYESLTVAALKDLLRDKELPLSGKKADLIARLEEAEEGGAAGGEDNTAKREADEPAEGESEAKRPKLDDEPQESAPKQEEDVKQEEPVKQEETASTEEKPDVKKDGKPGTNGASDGDSKEAGHGEVLERGHVYFFYRPKVSDHSQLKLAVKDDQVNLTSEDVHAIEDIAQFEMLLLPSDGGERRYRHITVGRKQMPNDAAGHRPFWAAVVAVDSDFDKISEGLQSKQYETKTQGTRNRPAARPAGRGSYVVHVEGEKSKRATHIAYVLSEPSEPGEVQKELAIQKEGAFVIQVKDPHADGPAGASLSEERRADYPEDLQSRFTTKFRPADPPAFLDYAGSELLLIAAKHDLTEEIGQGEAHKLGDQAEEEARANKDVFKELHLSKQEHPAAALHGDWA